MKKNLKKFQKLFVENFFVKPEQINFSTSFQEDLQLSENEFVAMLAYTENAFQVQISDNDIPKLKSVRDMVRCIAIKKNHTLEKRL